jgi:hypothetical protein
MRRSRMSSLGACDSDEVRENHAMQVDEGAELRGCVVGHLAFDGRELLARARDRGVEAEDLGRNRGLAIS